MTNKINSIFIMQNSLEDILKVTDILIEATRFEQLCLWEKYSLQNDQGFPYAIDWNEFSGKMLLISGHKKPIYVCISFCMLNTKLVGFWEATSELVDYELINNWFNQHTNNTIKMYDALNFSVSDFVNR